MAQKKDIDWEAIQREYRAGVMSIREIARQHDISDNLIRRRAKKHPKQWQRDLTKRVRVAVSRKIVTDAVLNGVRDDTVRTQGDEDRIVEEASDTAIGVVRSHRKSIAKTAAIEESLSEELAALQMPSLLPDGTAQEKAPALSTKVSTLLALVTAQERRIKMERQAFGINESSAPENDGETEIKITFVNPEGAL